MYFLIVKSIKMIHLAKPYHINISRHGYIWYRDIPIVAEGPGLFLFSLASSSS